LSIVHLNTPDDPERRDMQPTASGDSFPQAKEVAGREVRFIALLGVASSSLS